MSVATGDVTVAVSQRSSTRMIITICTIMATLMQSLDSTIANVALPYMQGTMSASQEEINWVLTSYIVAAAIMTAPTGFLASRFGRTRLYVVAVAGFTIASALCGLAGFCCKVRCSSGMSRLAFQYRAAQAAIWNNSAMKVA